MKRHLLSALALLLVGAAPPPPVATPADSAFVLVVNGDNATPALPRATVARIFLHKGGWPSGTAAVPVDQLEKSPVRADFTKAVHGKSVTAIKAYWQQKIFSGQDVPPIEEPTDDAVIGFVQGNRASVGYVTRGTALPKGVRVLELTD